MTVQELVRHPVVAMQDAWLAAGKPTASQGFDKELLARVAELPAQEVSLQRLCAEMPRTPFRRARASARPSPPLPRCLYARSMLSCGWGWPGSHLRESRALPVGPLRFRASTPSRLNCGPTSPSSASRAW
jgi:hypothetical protein